MSRSLNKVLLIGNVGVDPIIKKTPGGIPVTSFRMATSQTWKDRNGSLKEQTDWHTVVAWRGLAEIVERLVKKGSRIFVEGRLQTRNIEDKTLLDERTNIRAKQVVEILADNILLLDGKMPKNGNGKNYRGDDSFEEHEESTFHYEGEFFDHEVKFDDDFSYDFDSSDLKTEDN
jgi:single-strand DNA-binding protein